MVVVYLYQEQTGGTWTPRPTTASEGPYLPLRCGRLVDGFLDGDVAHFYFAVSDYVKPSRRRTSARRLLNRDVRFRTGSRKKSPFSYAHLAPDLGLGASRANDALAFQRFVGDAYRPGEWRTRSSGSAPLDVTYDVVFVRVAGVYWERKGRLLQLAAAERTIPGNPFAEYELTCGTTYYIKVATHLAARLPSELPGQGNARLRLVFDPRLMTPAGATSFRLASTYDLHYWPIVPNRVESQRSILSVACEHDIASDRKYFARRELLCPEILLPISIVAPPDRSRRISS